MFSSYDRWRLRGPDEVACRFPYPDRCLCSRCREEAAWERADLFYEHARERAWAD